MRENFAWLDWSPSALAALEIEQAEAQVAAADLLRRTGARFIVLDDTTAVGIWSDTDSLDIRRALKTLDLDHFPVKYLGDPDVPLRYKVR